MRPIFRAVKSGLLLCVPALLFGCGGKTYTAPTVALEMDGPPLAVVGEYSGMKLSGTLERTAMAGFGELSLSADKGEFFSCTAKIDDPPTEKRRVRGTMLCSGDRKILFSLRNTGPDQGLGIGKERPEGDLLIIFYHPSKEEAERRFPAVKEDIAKARKLKKQ